MELFRYRNLAFASCIFLVTLLFSFYMNTIIRLTTLVLAGVVILFLAIVYLTNGGVKSLNAMCRFTPALLFVIIAMVISMCAFNDRGFEKYLDGDEHTVSATVLDVRHQTEYMGNYEIEISSIDGEKFNKKAAMTMFSTPLARGDILTSKGYFQKTTHSDIGFDEANYNLSRGITVKFESDNYSVLGREKMAVQDFLDTAKSFLIKRFNIIESADTSSMLRALFLGDKSDLSHTVKRDFTRIGLSHALALSGMHITIIVTIFGLAISPLPFSRVIKELLLIFVTFLFVGITGFSDSAMRAGIMVCLVYSFHFFGSRLNLFSSLFYSVAIICIFDPFCIFSVSLTLSFLAMLGCIVSSKFIHGVKLFQKIKFKPFKFIILTFVTSLFACLFTLPIISVHFGSLSILSPITNIVITPLLSFLIYLSPIYLLTSGIPYISFGIEYICTKVTELAIHLSKSFSFIDNVTIPINHIVQFVGVFIITVFIIGLISARKRFFRFMVAGIFLGITVFIVGTIYLFSLRQKNVFVGGFNFENSDIIFLENQNQLTIIDVTPTKESSYIYSNSVAAYLGYYEINNYVITDYSSTTHICFYNLSNNIILKRVFVPVPQNEDEKQIFENITTVAKDKNISVSTFDSQLKFSNATITFSKSTYLPRSSKRVVAFSIENNTSRFTYLGAGAFELCDYFIDDCAYLSDIIIFGSYGAKYKFEYEYKTPYLDYCVFFGESANYATIDFYNAIKSKKTECHRFCLSP